MGYLRCVSIPGPTFVNGLGHCWFQTDDEVDLSNGVSNLSLFFFYSFSLPYQTQKTSYVILDSHWDLSSNRYSSSCWCCVGAGEVCCAERLHTRHAEGCQHTVPLCVQSPLYHQAGWKGFEGLNCAVLSNFNLFPAGDNIHLSLYLCPHCVFWHCCAWHSVIMCHVSCMFSRKQISQCHVEFIYKQMVILWMYSFVPIKSMCVYRLVTIRLFSVRIG